jgi:hypothetical protein
MADDSIAGYDITDVFNSPSLVDTSYTSGTTSTPPNTPSTASGNIQVFDDGSTLQVFDDGSTLVTDAKGNVQSTNANYTSNTTSPVSSGLVDQLKNAFGSAIYKKDAAGNLTNQLDLAKLGSLALGGYSAYQAANYQAPKSGYQGGIPSLAAVRTQIPQPTRTPYTGQPAMGRRYFTDTQYVAPAQAAATQAAQQQAVQPVQAAQGGLMAAKGTYLRGETDGMADKLDTSIEGTQPAKLSHGEFVVPADVVSHLGNGNSDAGAKKLYQMMDRIRVARTGTKKQGKEINPDKFMPGGQVGYAQGGIATFAPGGEVSTAPSGAALSSGLTGAESNLSNWAGPYVTNMLGQGQALAQSPYQAYTGQLTAGTSPLQQQAFNQAANLQVPSSIGQAAQTAQNISQQAQNLGYSPATFGNQFTAPSAYQAGTFDTDMFGTQQAQQYMNPYLQAALDPQLAEARRQSQITQTQNAAKLAGAGAYGGGRQAIMDTETQRNLATNLANITGQGYSTAFDKAQAAFNADQARKLQAQQLGEQSRQFGAGQAMTGAQLGAQYGLAGQQATEASRQFGANYGLQGLNTALQGAQTQGQLGTAQNQAALSNLNALSGLGQTQRGIESEAVAADKAQFEEERLNPYKMVQFQQSLLSGLPLAAQTYNQTAPNPLLSALSSTGSGYDLLNKILGGAATTPAKSSGQT